MKVLFHVDHSFSWAHGGVQNRVEQLLTFLPTYGVDAERCGNCGERLHDLFGSI